MRHGPWLLAALHMTTEARASCRAMGAAVGAVPFACPENAHCDPVQSARSAEVVPTDLEHAAAGEFEPFRCLVRSRPQTSRRLLDRTSATRLRLRIHSASESQVASCGVARPDRRLEAPAGKAAEDGARGEPRVRRAASRVSRPAEARATDGGACRPCHDAREAKAWDLRARGRASPTRVARSGAGRSGRGSGARAGHAPRGRVGGDWGAPPRRAARRTTRA
jgi:hypothetical protein